jgi:hypothetical protein
MSLISSSVANLESLRVQKVDWMLKALHYYFSIKEILVCILMSSELKCIRVFIIMCFGVKLVGTIV